jgi:hypothetical protein
MFGRGRIDQDFRESYRGVGDRLMDGNSEGLRLTHLVIGKVSASGND